MLYYFTYGSDSSQPFYGGWTEVNAPDIDTACEVFSLIHPNREGFLNCCSVYPDDEFKRTTMYANGNHGRRCHEKIFFRHTLTES